MIEEIDSAESQLEEALERMVQILTREHKLTDGIVIDVDEENFTCSVQVGSGTDTAVYDPVFLKVLTGSRASFIEIPTKGTQCTICFRDGKTARAQLLHHHQTDTLYINCGKVEYNGGKNGGWVKVTDLVDRLNLIEKDVNNLKSAFAAWVVAPNDGGAALKAAAATWFGQQLTTTTRQDIEDTSITH